MLKGNRQGKTLYLSLSAFDCGSVWFASGPVLTPPPPAPWWTFSNHLIPHQIAALLHELATSVSVRYLNFTLVLSKCWSLPSHLLSIPWNALSQNLLAQVSVDGSYHLFFVLSINADHSKAEQKREGEGGGHQPDRERREGEEIQISEEDGRFRALRKGSGESSWKHTWSLKSQINSNQGMGLGGSQVSRED